MKRAAYFAVNAYRPDGKRITISFGPVPENVDEASKVYATFSQWLKLYQSDAHKCLSYPSPYDAVSQMLNPSSIVVLGDLIDNYLKYADRAFKMTRTDRLSPNYQRLQLVLGLMEKYRSWPIQKFGADDMPMCSRC